MPDRGTGPVLDRRLLLQLGVAAGALAACSRDPSPSEPSTTVPPWEPPAEPMVFPDGFVWGAATSAFQVEGSTTADGRGPSIWDTFAAEPGRIADGATGDPAADHYRRWESDLDLLVELGLPAYRFSVAWPRVQPTGSGAVNQRGVDFYRRLVDGLLARGIHPAITLYHWDLPQPLQDAGGWAVRDTADRFADYAGIVFDALRDVDATWLTINEPKTTAYVGYRWGAHAPGITDEDQAAAAVHHQLLAHGRAVQAFRASGAAGGIGIALNLLPVYPVDRAADAAAVRVDAVENRLFLDPVLLGRYPTDAIGTQPGQLPADAGRFEDLVRDGDLEAISSPLDLLAIQYYGVTGVDDAGNQVPLYPTSLATWQQVHPEGLYDQLMDLLIDYPDAPPLVITENGIPDPTADGTVEDAERLEFLRAHLQQAARAIGDGVRLTGYYAWSLLDNFEWAEGLSQRWGLVHVDFETQERTPKDSARWYSTVVRANAVAPS
ncbi:GH1 family beta-glucosidase [Cellulomonas sp. Root137]|uniref:GH1 family beta-glucosidase n=1 Tax=Cellulomonas sp. Root137 TaxID=1736459 RepID=UPI0009EB1673|nr:GH1 family beta-glucosidase [Cellulomonas sp. Root137]